MNRLDDAEIADAEHLSHMQGNNYSESMPIPVIPRGRVYEIVVKYLDRRFIAKLWLVIMIVCEIMQNSLI